MGELKKTKTERSEKHQLAASGEQNNRITGAERGTPVVLCIGSTSKHEPANIRVCVAVAQ